MKEYQQSVWWDEMECNLSFLFPLGVVPMRRVSLERPFGGGDG